MDKIMLDEVAVSLEGTDVIGQAIASLLPWPACIYLHGEMGAGKTTLTKSILHGLGYAGAVTSPTYNLIQEYPLAAGILFHMDLYRLDDPDELEYLALGDLWSEQAMFLIEWPSKGGRLLLPASHHIQLSVASEESKEGKQARQIVFYQV